MDSRSEELLKELIKANEKTMKAQRATNIILLCFMAILVIAGIIVVPIAASLLAKVNNLLFQAEDVLVTIKDTTTQVSTMVSANAAPLTESVEKLTTLDIDGLNKAITDLQDAIGPMANAMRIFK